MDVLLLFCIFCTGLWMVIATVERESRKYQRALRDSLELRLLASGVSVEAVGRFMALYDKNLKEVS